MKAILIALVLITLFSFKGNEEKKYKVEGTLEQWNAIYQVIDLSTAPHVQVEEVKKFLATQFAAQMDTTKKK
jgi:hypothetical protein